MRYFKRRYNIKFFIILCFTFSINANAYCITNKTEQNLLFVIDSHLSNGDSTRIFQQVIKVNNKVCNTIKKTNSGLSFYAFLDDNAIEGCDIFGKYDSNIILKTYEVFDNCQWESK